MNSFSLFCCVCGLFLMVTKSLNAQDTLASIVFPDSWVGIYQGELNIFNAQGKRQVVPMKLEILPIDASQNYTWAIIYGADEAKGRRPYELTTVDANKGHYRIDEKNSIEIDAFLLDNNLISRFEVMGGLLLTSYEKRDSTIWFDVIYGKMSDLIHTGDQVINGDTIPPVASYPIGTMQRAELFKVN